MAGLEVVVRPVVFPNIRPQAPRVLASSDDDNFAVIQGSGGKLIDLPRTWSVSESLSQPHKESRRQFDKVKVKQVDARGNVNPDTFIEVERLKRVRVETELGPIKVLYATPPPVANVEITQTDVTRSSS